MLSASHNIFASHNFSKGKLREMRCSSRLCYCWVVLNTEERGGKKALCRVNTAKLLEKRFEAMRSWFSSCQFLCCFWRSYYISHLVFPAV